MIYLNKFDSHSSYEEKLNGGLVDIILPNVSYCKDVKDVHYLPYNLIKFYVGDITPQQTVKIYTDETTFDEVQVNGGNKWYTYGLPKDKGLYRISGDTVTKVVIKSNIRTSGATIIIPSSTVEASFKGSNTSNVTSMNNMFSGCNKLTSLDLSNLNTINVTSMSSMFQNCNNLTSLTINNFDTTNVSGMSSMFQNCSSLESLDLNKFKTSNVTQVNSIFNSCSGLKTLYLSGWDISKITDTQYMFYDCRSLASLDLSGWDTSNVNYMEKMFNGCNALKTIKMVGCSEATVNKIKAQLTKDDINGVTITT